MNKLVLLFVPILSLLFFSCKDEKCVTCPSDATKTVVIMSDFEAGSDLIITMLGSIKSQFPDANVEFIKLRSYDVREASYLLDVAVRDYPAGTYFAAVVDPGSSSVKIAFDCGGSKILVPDNGIATRILKRHTPENIRYVDDTSLLGGDWHNLSFQTIYSKAFTALVRDEQWAKFGTVCAEPQLFSIQEPETKGDTTLCEVLYRDNFGNCVTNLPSSYFSGFNQGDILKVNLEEKSFFIKYGVDYYSVPVGQNVCFFNNSKRLELAIDYGSMTDRYGISAGSLIKITKSKPVIGILRYNSSDVSTTIVSGMRNRLAELGLIDGQTATVIEKNAEGDISAFTSLIQELVDEGADVIIPVSTPATQAAVRQVPSKIPIVFTYVSSPTTSGILNVREKVSGLSDATDFDQYCKFIQELIPGVSTIASIYNANEANSVFTQNSLINIVPSFGMSYVSKSVTSYSEILPRIKEVNDLNINVLVIIADNLMNNSILHIAGNSIYYKLILLSDATDNVKNGALAALSVDYDKLAIASGDFAYDVILGMNPDDKPIKYLSSEVISINTHTASAIGFQFPASILAKARYVFP